MTSTRPSAAPVTGEEIGGTSHRELRLLALDSPPLAATTDGSVRIIDKPPELSWWDWAVFLLHTVAKIEHALLAQYLYAAFSLRPKLGDGDAPGAGEWRDTILGIAVQEMGHLLTEQNILWAIGGPLTLEREEFPFETGLYPFPFRLEPLRKKALARYVVAEMPAEPELGEDELTAIRRHATGEDGHPANRVGLLFDTLIHVFAEKLHDSDIRPDTATTRQGRPEEWAPDGGIILRTITTRDEARAALQAIGEEGEGTGKKETGEESHFARFLTIYRNFPEDEGRAAALTHDVPVNPNTLPEPPRRPAVEAGRITAARSRLWAALFNLRYRMLLVDLAHALRLPYPSDQREELRNWAFAEMYRLGPLTDVLVGLPRTESGGGPGPQKAGPPFELPYTLALPEVERDRWHLHRVLLDASTDLVARITPGDKGERDALAGITDSDTRARAFVDRQSDAR